MYVSMAIQIRWKETISILDSQLSSVEGDAFLAAASISYLGPFSGAYRDRMQAEWQKYVTEDARLSCTSSFQLTDFLSDPIELRDWGLQVSCHQGGGERREGRSAEERRRDRISRDLYEVYVQQTRTPTYVYVELLCHRDRGVGRQR